MTQAELRTEGTRLSAQAQRAAQRSRLGARVQLWHTSWYSDPLVQGLSIYPHWALK